MLTWSSWLAEVGMLSTLAGWASCLFSLVSAAAVTWGTRPDQRSVRATLATLAEVQALAAGGSARIQR